MTTTTIAIKTKEKKKSFHRTEPSQTKGRPGSNQPITVINVCGVLQKQKKNDNKKNYEINN